MEKHRLAKKAQSIHFEVDSVIGELIVEIELLEKELMESNDKASDRIAGLEEQIRGLQLKLKDN